MLKPSLCCREARQVLPTGAKMPKYVKVLIDDACGFLKEFAREVKTHNALLWTAMNIGRFKLSPLRGLEVLLRLPVSLVLMSEEDEFDDEDGDEGSEDCFEDEEDDYSDTEGEGEGSDEDFSDEE
ncbi:hypothetical protein TCE0_042r14324 [Talaromyces pinophilus]|uniref:Uncharacterized protein n=1 Tax=Talaromyces pinophilus TaxID=128442 RepID=A0A6V8HHJ3_TALPI|nr:hypothetical protein TCE0_042r14324 [Talaromyces pinophilus]